jgi:hypothetical protein
MPEKRKRGRPPRGDTALTLPVTFRLSVADREALERLAQERESSASLVAREIVERSLRSQDTD